MSWVAAAAAGGAIIAGSIQADAAEDAAAAQTGAAGKASAEQRRQFNISRQDFAPYRQVGSAAVTSLGRMMGLSGPGMTGYPESLVDISGGAPKPIWDLYESDPAYRKAWDQVEAQHRQNFSGQNFTAGSDPVAIERHLRMLMPKRAPVTVDQNGSVVDVPLTRKFSMQDFENDPVIKAGLQFGLDEGTKAVRRTLGATGMARSGAAIKGLTRYATDYTGTKAAESYNRFYADQDRIFNRLSGLAGTGQTATTNTAQLGAGVAANIGNNMIGAANARGAASIAGGNAMAGGVGSIGNSLQTKFMLDDMDSRRQQQYRMWNTPQVQPMVPGQFNLDTYG